VRDSMPLSGHSLQREVVALLDRRSLRWTVAGSTENNGPTAASCTPLADSEQITTERVIVAAGIAAFPHSAMNATVPT
jgi:hypothetical protein